MFGCTLLGHRLALNPALGLYTYESDTLELVPISHGNVLNVFQYKTDTSSSVAGRFLMKLTEKRIPRYATSVMQKGHTVHFADKWRFQSACRYLHNLSIQTT